MITVTVLGSCRTHGPLDLLAREGRVRLNNAGTRGYVHSPGEMIQLMRVLRRELTLPDAVLPFFPPECLTDLRPLPISHADTDIFIVEVSSIKEFVLEDRFLQMNLLVETLRQYNAKTHFAGLCALMNRNPGCFVHLEGLPPDCPAPAAALLNAVQGRTLMYGQLLEELKTLRRLLRKPMLLVSHIEGKVMPDDLHTRLYGRKEGIRMLTEASRELGAPIARPGDLLQEFPQAEEVMRRGSTTHYAEAFLPTVAAWLLKKHILPLAAARGISRGRRKQEGRLTPESNFCLEKEPGKKDANAREAESPARRGRKLITLFDTTVSADNLGNAIIMEAVEGQLEAMFPEDFEVRLPFADLPGERAADLLRKSDHVFFGGANCINGAMDEYSSWAVPRYPDLAANVILCGVGWGRYDAPTNAFTRKLLHAVLHPTALHSVRDGYTRQRLQAIGVRNALNTACPTMWGLTPEHCAAIPVGKAENALLTFSKYSQAPEFDLLLAKAVSRLYKKVYFWVQQPEDEAYCRVICKNACIVPPRLRSLDALLASEESLDYVGTRLHAGIRAMQHKKRSLIIAIDNRATEISRDTALPTVRREELHMLETALRGEFETALRLPWEAIAAWKAQFPPNRRA